MSTSFIHELGAQYMASVLFALTMLATGAARAAWRRRNPGRRRAQTTAEPAEPPVPGAADAVPTSAHESATSSAGRREVSS
ncbi:hypothetical protein ACFC09_29640 [Streptomyces sp. NPDC056161]|uniref:hypothetical protein n=1 Tax=Streptomyces sp. NPDC056161 TaxID=3345732 RepID=UPI0035D54F98